MEANSTAIALTNVTNISFDYGYITLDITERIEERINITNEITNNKTDTQFVTEMGNPKFKIHYYNFVTCVEVSILFNNDLCITSY